MQQTNLLHQRCQWVSYGLIAAALLLSLLGDLVPALLAGLLVYQAVRALAPKIRLRALQGQRGRLIIVAGLATLITGLIVGSITAAVIFFSTGEENLTLLFDKMAEILESSREILPHILVQYLPASVDDLRIQSIAWLREHASELQSAGKDAGLMIAHILVGLIIGALISLRAPQETSQLKPLAAALQTRISRLGNAFANVVFAQFKIASINAIATGIYLAVILPMFGIELPLVKTMIALTFVFGLLPVVGNLMSNTVIVIVSLSHSLIIAGVSLLYLIIIHKVEYFLNAKIIGNQIRARPWEILAAMLIMEVTFGMAGVVAAAIYYAYLKDELTSQNLV